MRSIFDIDSPVMSTLIKIFDCMCLSVVWLVCCLPIVTAGASTTAMYSVIHRYIRKDETHMWRIFFNSFRENFARATLCWLIVLAGAAVLVMDVLVFRTFALHGELLGKLYALVLLLCGILITWSAYLFACIARIPGNVRDAIRYSFLLMTMHPGMAVLVFLPTAIAILLSVMAPGFLTITPAASCWLSSRTIEQVFAKHLRPEDEEPESILNDSEE